MASIVMAILMIISGILAIVFQDKTFILNLGIILSYASVLFALLSLIFLTIIVIPKKNNIKENKFVMKFFAPIGFVFFTTSLFDFYVHGTKNINLFLLMGLGLLYIIISSITDS